jgi:hypothetical protein
MRIGYAGYSPLNNSIADRRRLLHWAMIRGHEVVDSRDLRADLIVVTSSADLGYWANTHSKVPIVLDVVDGLIGEQSSTRDLLRGYAYWATGKSSGTFPHRFSSMLFSVAKKSNRIICSSEEQISAWNKSGFQSFDILDFHEELPKLGPRISTPDTDPIEIFWEGLPATLGSMHLLNGIFEAENFEKIQLNILTNLNAYKYMNTYKKIDVKETILNQISSKKLALNLIQWDPEKVVENVLRSALGVIPLSHKSSYNHLKAENRLLIMWRLGLPVLTSPLPSYVRTMRLAKIDGICEDKSEWNQKFKLLVGSHDLQSEVIAKANHYLDKFHSEEELLLKWDSALSF